ncbi:acyltransferase [Cupriavidus sp. AcVe19-6a]|uniref:acyltransferase family protein n=1 Tax=Cupriavidus sp. AcVe19-6a TaxID=2821358 RepID=UPI001AE8A6DD|nr:hypothetical protein [Cupriavidus sp. AcVe19-6a]MBP0639331.1 hypothetical protein [Cupriavidus sp. AcVe19-6a]
MTGTTPSPARPASRSPRRSSCAGFAQKTATITFSWQRKTSAPTGWNDVGWSVSAEWFAYVWFPLFLLAAPRLSKFRVALMAILALAVVGVVEATSPTHLSLSGGIARLIPEFMLGVLLCRLREAMPGYNGFVWGSLLSLLICAIGVKIGFDTVFVAGAAGLVFSLSYGIGFRL